MSPYVKEDQFNCLTFVKGSPPTLVADALLGKDNSFSCVDIAFVNPAGFLKRAVMGETIDDTRAPWDRKESIIKHMFSWQSTVQGHDYWREIDRRLLQGEKMPPEVMAIFRAIWDATTVREVLSLEEML